MVQFYQQTFLSRFQRLPILFGLPLDSSMQCAQLFYIDNRFSFPSSEQHHSSFPLASLQEILCSSAF
ncbi:hypothetical protein HanIR_Chr13g0629001 [Helianthus annuus]|nr:hypothetical protein HanIR_Chr13g0629001 [Helianthus annuus]